MRYLLLCLAGLLLCGCTYYRVRDVPTGKEYITDNYHLNYVGGAVHFTDLKTGKIVTLSSSEQEVIPADVAKKEIASQKD